MKKIVLLYSGGADSAYMLILALRMNMDVILVSYDYGQKHKEELDFGERLLKSICKGSANVDVMNKVDVMNIDLRGAFSHTESNLLGLKSFQRSAYPGVHEMHVPGRNSVFISTAFSIAETHEASEIWIGCDYSDRILQFPDCYQEWIFLMDKMTQIAGSVPVRVKAPLLGLEKQDVLDLLVAEGVDLSEVYSGYQAPVAATT